MNFDIAKKLEFFKVDKKRHALVVDVEFYQMNLIDVVNKAIDGDALLDENNLPAWTKFAANPVSAKGFWHDMLVALFLGKGARAHNTEYQFGRGAKNQRVAMMFLPGGTRVRGDKEADIDGNLTTAVTLAQQSLGTSWVVAEVSGNTMTNYTAGQKVKEIIEKAGGNNVLIISAGMASRSFSVPQITELYLAYDNGGTASTIQKMSRALTPSDSAKVGQIVSLSFDPNRDDKFDAMLIETAKNYQKNKGIKDLRKALAEVIETIDIFKCKNNGAIKIDPDTYLAETLDRKSIDRLVGKVANLGDLSPEQIHAIAQGKAEVFRAATVDAAKKGKTKLAKGKKGIKISKKDSSAKEIALAREVIVTISQNIDIIRYYGGNTIDEAFAIMDTEGESIQNEVTEQFGVEYDLIKDLVFNGVINKGLLELKFAL